MVWPLSAVLDEAALDPRLFAAPTPTRGRAVPDLARLHQELKRAGVTLHLLWEEYREVHPDGYGYSSQFREFCRRWAKKPKPSMRQQHRAGEKRFIDFSGKRPQLIDGRTGEEIPVELFVAVLGASSFALQDRAMLREAKAFLRFFQLNSWERGLDEAVHSGSPNFELTA